MTVINYTLHLADFGPLEDATTRWEVDRNAAIEGVYVNASTSRLGFNIISALWGDKVLGLVWFPEFTVVVVLERELCR